MIIVLWIAYPFSVRLFYIFVLCTLLALKETGLSTNSYANIESYLSKVSYHTWKVETSNLEEGLHILFWKLSRNFWKSYDLLVLKLYKLDDWAKRYIYVWVCLCLCVCALLACLVPAEARRKCWITWNWSYRQLWAATCMLGIRPSSFERVASALNHWAVSPAP